MGKAEEFGLKKPPIERYFTILELLTAFPSGLQLRELTDMLDLPKPSVHRILSVLQSTGLVAAAEGPGARYVLGERTRRLVFLAASDTFVASLANAQLEQLSGEFGETCYIARLEGAHVRSVVMDSPESPWRGYVLPGKRMYAHATASAKAIVAHQPEELVDKILSGPLAPLTRFTCTEPAKIREEYARIRQMGYATCIEEVEEGLSAFAVPVVTEPWGVNYAIAMLGPKPRITTMLAGGAIARFQQAAAILATAMSDRPSRVRFHAGA